MSDDWTAARASEPLLMSDAELVDRVLQGDVDLYAELVRRHQRVAFHVAFTLVRDTETAADMVQDALIRAYATLGHCREPGRFRAWLLRAVRNRCLDHLKAARQRDVPLDEQHHALAAPDVDPLDGLGHRAAIAQALAALPESLRDAFLLRHVQELEYEEIASLLGTTVAASKMRVSRARDILRRSLSAAMLAEEEA
jgi:RNA polymerase sigma-70 factor, ECF subfamily